MRIKQDKTILASPALAALALATLALITAPVLANSPGDFDGSEYVDLADVSTFLSCVSGPEATPPGGCEDADFDPDGDIDLRDLATFQTLYGHTPIPLRDTLGNVITINGAAPYNGHQTCGGTGCHDTYSIANGFLFQQGRTDLAGNVDMHDDYHGDGRSWIKGAARYGKWGQTFTFLLAAKNNDNESQIEQGSFAWVRDCSPCHVGGGPGEFDRDDVLYYNEATGQFGWEVLGTDPSLDGDYVDINYATGELRQAPWDVTGVSGPDCLYCHRAERNITRERRDKTESARGFLDAGRGDNNYSWRAGVLGAADALVDDSGRSVPAFAAAGTAGQGWFSTLDLGASPPVLQIDYSVGVAEGSLVANQYDEVSLVNGFMTRPPKDRVCDSCHPFEVVTGTTWFDERDVMFRRFTNRHDEDPSNDIPDDEARVCTVCHLGNVDHNFARGNSLQVHYRDEIDWVNLKTCRSCHLYEIAPGVPNPDKHPDAPDVGGGTDETRVHFAGTAEAGPMASMSCQACHIPYSLANGLLFRDNTVGSIGWTNQYYSADPLNPADPDKSHWYPSLRWKEDSDGRMRLFPASVWVIFYWGDWDQNGTPGDLSDDVIRPLITWRANQAIGPVNPLPIVQDDDGDGVLEIDQPDELLSYFDVLKGNDSYGRQVAANPVLVRGPRVWYEDAGSRGGVNSFEHEGTGIPMDAYPYLWGKDHNVLAASEAWGAGDDCQVCHRLDGLSPVFDRLILVDPYGPGTQPEYKTVREMTSVDTTSYHNNIILKDALGNALTVASTTPYSGRETCGGACHDIDRISNGTIHQQGRTDADGNIVMHDDFFGDGRWWVRSAGMYGRWSGGGGGLNRQTAGKTNANESEMDMTAFYWTGFCGGCHAGGGVSEFDRDGIRYWDQATGQFGYEVLGLTAEDVELDGDYAHIDVDGDASWSLAPWDVTGVAGPECLHCHRANRTYVDLEDMHREWRAAVMGTREALVDSQGQPVPAYAAAGTAGQGWFSALDTQAIPPVLQIDYSVGVAASDLTVNIDDELVLATDFLARPPRDQACWGCHLPGGFQNKRGTVWFDERDVMYAGFNNLLDEDPENDIPPELSTACNRCHPNDLDHDEAKGNSPYAQFRNELDWVGFRGCRECHLTEIDGVPNPLKDPAATEPVHPIHDDTETHGTMMLKLSCQFCHIPYPLERAIIVTDRSLTGTAVTYFTDEFLSADPLNPSDPDKSKWYPAFRAKTDSNGSQRFFPQKTEVAIYWADWDQNGTPGDLSDDTIHPIILWRLRQITSNSPLPGVTDDNGDGKLEVNLPAEMLLYMQALKGNDSYGRQVAANPVLVKGERIWYEDSQDPDGVSWFEHEGSGVHVESFEVFGLDHNVLAAKEAWGIEYNEQGVGVDTCGHCHLAHNGGEPTLVMDRLILVDPFGPDGLPVYKTVREMTGLNPP